MGWLEIWIRPPNGQSISKIMKMALETERARTSSAPSTVALERVSDPKRVKMRASQKIRVQRNGAEIELPVGSPSNQRCGM